LARSSLGWSGSDFYNISEFYTTGFVWSVAAWPVLDTTAMVSSRMIRAKLMMLGREDINSRLDFAIVMNGRKRINGCSKKL